MKKIIVVMLFFLGTCQSVLASSLPQDVITGFLTEYADGKPTGRTIQIEINIMKFNKQITWQLDQVTINSDSYDKSTDFQITKATSEGSDSGLLYLENINWMPGKSLNCLFRPDGNLEINLSAKKTPNTKYGWDIVCKGKINLAGSPNAVPWEWKYSKEIDLKYNKVRLVNLYRK